MSSLSKFSPVDILVKSQADMIAAHRPTFRLGLIGVWGVLHIGYLDEMVALGQKTTQKVQSHNRYIMFVKSTLS